jgi:hypothetical protein
LAGNGLVKELENPWQRMTRFAFLIYLELARLAGLLMNSSYGVTAFALLGVKNIYFLQEYKTDVINQQQRN